jgi:hypothetical protein
LNALLSLFIDLQANLPTLKQNGNDLAKYRLLLNIKERNLLLKIHFWSQDEWKMKFLTFNHG